MPIFEYQCKSCNTKYEVLHKTTEKSEDVTCPKCQSKENKRLLSSFSASMGTSSGGGCASGNCDVPYSGGCASGMCGLN
jgi:putative FmdB family regulatory protein